MGTNTISKNQVLRMLKHDAHIIHKKGKSVARYKSAGLMFKIKNVFISLNQSTAVV